MRANCFIGLSAHLWHQLKHQGVLCVLGEGYRQSAVYHIETLGSRKKNGGLDKRCWVDRGLCVSLFGSWLYSCGSGDIQKKEPSYGCGRTLLKPVQNTVAFGFAGTAMFNAQRSALNVEVRTQTLDSWSSIRACAKIKHFTHRLLKANTERPARSPA